MLEIRTTSPNVGTHAERIKLVKENRHLMDITDNVKLFCSKGNFEYNYLNDLFKVGEQASFRIGLVTREVVRITENEFEIHDTTDGWLSTVVDTETMKAIVKGDIQLIDLEWK